MYKAKFEDLGKIKYNDAWDYQEKLFAELLAKKNDENRSGYILFCEHNHVYTLGKSGNEENLLVDILKLNQLDAEFVKTNRGGDITYHGPGQIVGYPIIDLDCLKIGIKEYVFRIEESIICAIAEMGILGGRKAGATGVWLDAETAKERKICAIGIKASRGVTMHGFAFNVETNLEYFNMINPCGFSSKAVSSVAKELIGANMFSMDECKKLVKKHLAANLGFEYID